MSNFAPPPWVSDDQRPGCALCRRSFSLFARRHHCRLCGDVYCTACSDYTAIVPFFHNNHRPVRVCGVCHSHCILNTPDRRLYQLSATTQKHIQLAIEAFQQYNQNEQSNPTTMATQGQPPSSPPPPPARRESKPDHSCHPEIKTTEVDLWWMGQRNREALPCTWGQEKTLTNIPQPGCVEVCTPPQGL